MSSWWGFLLDDASERKQPPEKSKTPANPAARPSASPTKSESKSKVARGVSTCRRCLLQFERHKNSPTACRFHPESYSGETKQRWAPPGEENCGEVHFYWSCCGDSDRDSLGCSTAAHVGFDDGDGAGSFDGCFKDYGAAEPQISAKSGQKRKRKEGQGGRESCPTPRRTSHLYYFCYNQT